MLLHPAMNKRHMKLRFAIGKREETETRLYLFQRDYSGPIYEWNVSKFVARKCTHESCAICNF